LSGTPLIYCDVAFTGGFEKLDRRVPAMAPGAVCGQCSSEVFGCAYRRVEKMGTIKADKVSQVTEFRPPGFDNGGNARGRANDARNKAPLAMEALLESASEAITRKLIDKALEGDMTALRICVERLLPPRRDCPVVFDLPAIETAADALSASTSVLAACAKGALSPGEAATVMDLIATHTRTLEVAEIEARLIALEKERKP
jgi:hypothetical protein